MADDNHSALRKEAWVEVQLILSRKLIARIDAFGYSHRLPNRTEAIIRLVKAGLRRHEEGAEEDDFRFTRRVLSQTAAIRRLIEAGLCQEQRRLFEPKSTDWHRDLDVRRAILN